MATAASKKSSTERNHPSLAGQQIRSQHLPLADSFDGLPGPAASEHDPIGVVDDHNRLAALFDQSPAPNRVIHPTRF